MTVRDALAGIARLLAPGEPEVAERVLRAYDAPEAYLSEHADRLEERGIDTPIDNLAWIALVDSLDDHHLLGEVDWKEAPEDIRYALDQLTSRPADEVWAWHDPEEHFFTHDFLERAGEHTYAAGKALVLLDIESDCYPLAYLPVARVAVLIELGTDAGYHVEVFGRPVAGSPRRPEPVRRQPRTPVMCSIASWFKREK